MKHSIMEHNWQFVIRLYGPKAQYKGPLFRKWNTLLPIGLGWNVLIGVFDLFYGERPKRFMVVNE